MTLPLQPAAKATLQESLQIALITYNRAQYLERTFSQLLNSPFASCSITVLDNCSADDTQAVCGRYREQFPQLAVIRHKKNIGACANYLRAVELCSSPYTWILCDDDIFDFTECGDVVAAIETAKSDLISVGSPGQFDWERGLTTTTRELLARGARYFGVFTFVPGVIFKNELFDSECLASGYRNIQNSYPHFLFVKKAYDRNCSVYVSQRQILSRDPHSSLPGDLYALAVYVASCGMIEDRKLRGKVIDQIEESYYILLLRIGAGIVMAKMAGRPTSRAYLELMLVFVGRQKLLLLLLAPLIVLPAPLLRMLWKFRRSVQRRPTAEPGADYDPFRL